MLFRHWFALAVCTLLTAFPLHAVAYPMPPEPSSTELSRYGQKLLRTMNRLAAATPTDRKEVRILFYGQSITDEAWTNPVVADLRARFPNAQIVAENRHLSGFASQVLVKAMEHDVFSFRPDLIFFHVYGNHIEYENILIAMRSRTTAEIAICNDHTTEGDVDANGNYLTSGWTAQIDGYIRTWATKYKCELIDLHREWKAYLDAQKLRPAALLADSVHPNAQGYWLMSELVKRQLLVKPSVSGDPERVMDVLPAEPMGSEGQTQVLTFSGNRVDLVFAPDAEVGAGGTVEILINGQKPSDIPELSTLSRPNPKPWNGRVVPYIVRSQAPLLPEDWTLSFTAVQPGYIAYELRGSLTGFDGLGRTDQDFVSNSQRITIGRDAANGEGAWFGLAWNSTYSAAVGQAVTWTVERNYRDTVTYEPASGGLEPVVLVAHGLPHAQYTLELRQTGPGRFPLAAIRAYRPPLNRAPKFWTDTTELALAESGTQAALALTAEGSWSSTGVPAWLKLSPENGIGSQSLTVQALANNPFTEPRTAEIVLKRSSAAPITLRVTQAGASVASPFAELTAAANGWKLAPHGWIYDAAFPYVLHLQRGWIYIIPTGGGAFSYYAYTDGRWYWTHPVYGAWRYDYASQAWTL